MAPSLSSLVAPLLLLVPTLYISRIVHGIVPAPYMDEVFHIPQAQRYCQHDFQHWDDKITTPPGLYLVSVGLSRILQINLCSVPLLRMVNVIFGFLNTWIMFLLVEKFHENQNPKPSLWIRVLNACSLGLFPLLFFFQFLYYTDLGATFFVLLGYYLLLHRQYLGSSLVGLISLTFRQTNVIWQCFFLALGVRNELMILIQEEEKEAQPPADPANKRNPFSDPVAGKSRTRGFAHVLYHFVVLSLWNFNRIFVSVFPLFVPLVAFGIFLIWNGGIVLGDKTNHVATLHFPQLFYFVTFALSLTAFITIRYRVAVQFFWVIIEQLRSVVKLARLALGGGMFWHLIQDYTIEHPFLLADNRHYPFYLWKNIFRRFPNVRFAAIPFYWFAGWEMLRNLGQTQTVVWIAAYIIAVVLTLVPAPLIEFRYYLVPFLFYRLHIRQPGLLPLVVELSLFLSLNFVTLWLFLQHPFEWADRPGELQRFMW